MYGKLFERMYTGSMMGGGAMIFAVWPYVIAHMKPNRDRKVFTVELNTQLMAVLIGESEPEIAKIISKFCEPDLNSRTPDNEGRKLIKLGTYLYEVVNGSVYDEIRREYELRESNRKRQEKYYYSKKLEQEAVGNDQTTTPTPASKPSKPKTQFTPPTMEMCKLQAAKIGLSELEAEKFFHFYESKGWSVGKGKMVSWVSSMSGWKIKSNETNQRNNQQPRQSIDRNIGNANEGKAHLYKALGNVSVPG